MVAKKTAEGESASGRSTAAAANAEGSEGSADTPHGAAKKAAGGARKATPAKKAATKRAAAKKSPAKKAAAKRTEEPAEAAPKKAAAKKTSAKKTPSKKTASEKAGTQHAGAKKTTAAKTAQKAATKAAAKKAATGKASDRTDVRIPPRKKAAGQAAHEAASAAGAAEAAKQTGARTVGTEKTVAAGDGPAAVPTARAAAAATPQELAVRPGEDPWTPQEVAEARTELEGEVTRLNAQLAASEAALMGLMRDSGGGAGDDDADMGSKNITREHELSLAAGAREMLEQTERALLRLDAGTYGVCENCGKPIGKARMQAFPRATLCVECKQKQERRG
ncbi:TraR/DksA family transcriptional regulator [Streptomyces sp. NPDC005963]|uniref:TraR/DksA family transcriptional regulator n=1 Tax=Streptomyces sp. NPDC005963 TaxID=3156721 RepID=UPI0033FC0802